MVECKRNNTNRKSRSRPKSAPARDKSQKKMSVDNLSPLSTLILVGEGGFEPPKSLTTDLQSAPFGHSGTLPHYGAGGRTRTPDLLITNQLLYQLSYTSTFSCSVIISYRATFVNSFLLNHQNFILYKRIRKRLTSLSSHLLCLSV